MIKVSIIVPVYNVEKYLEKCLDSLIKQTLNEIQIIIINDGSIDNSCNIIKLYKKKYTEKIILVEKENGGLSDARNTGLKYSEGEYIGFVDGDDYVDKKMYEKMYNIAKTENADMVICDFYNDYGNKLIYKYSNFNKGKSNDIFFQRSNAVNKIISRKIIENCNIKFPVGLKYEDNEFFFKIIPYLKNIRFINEPFYYYVQRINSIVNTQNEKTEDIFIIWNNILEYYYYNNLYEIYKKQLEYRLLVSILCTSFFRMVKIKNKKLRKKLLKRNWEYIKEKIPYWNKNLLLKKNNSRIDMFIKSQNYLMYKIYSFIFPLLYRLKR